MVFLLAFLGLAGRAGAQPLVSVGTVRMHEGDELRWADPTLDDSTWRELRFGEVPGTTGIVVLRSQVRLEAKHFRPGKPTGILLAALAACEVAWDGQIIGRSGRPAASTAGEIPGPVQDQWALPDRLATPGDHLAALRCSAHHRGFQPRQGYWALLAGDYGLLTELLNLGTRIALGSLSGMAMVAIFALALFLADRRDRSFLLLGLVCLSAGALLLAESWRNVFGYSYDRHFLRLVVLAGLTALLNLAIVSFVLVRFSRPSAHSARLTLGALALGLGLSLLQPGWDTKTLSMFLAGLTLATAWVARAAWRRERGSIPALTGLLVLLAALFWRPYVFADWAFYLALDVLLLCLLVAHAFQVRHLRREHEVTLLRSARLETELLRRHIQPHFLMNTLTALSEWIEQEPKVAVGLIESISEEFRILGRIADRPLIPLAEELHLCRTHIAILNRRRDREYELEVTGADSRDLVPPALLHTLVENAITHDGSKEPRVVLHLSVSQGERERVRYVFTAPREPGSEVGPEGTGLRYVRARLQESFGAEATLSAGPDGELWRTEILIPRRR